MAGAQLGWETTTIDHRKKRRHVACARRVDTFCRAGKNLISCSWKRWRHSSARSDAATVARPGRRRRQTCPRREQRARHSHGRCDVPAVNPSRACDACSYMSRTFWACCRRGDDDKLQRGRRWKEGARDDAITECWTLHSSSPSCT